MKRLFVVASAIMNEENQSFDDFLLGLRAEARRALIKKKLMERIEASGPSRGLSDANTPAVPGHGWFDSSHCKILVSGILVGVGVSVLSTIILSFILKRNKA